MKRLSNIEVEPLGEQRWATIERSLLSQLELEPRRAVVSLPPRRRPSALAFRIVAILAAATAVAVLASRAFPERAAVEQPSRITTGETASHLALPGLSLDIQPESAVVVGAETPHGQLIVVDRGSVVCETAARSSNAPLIVQAGGARVRVVGTRFSVTRLGETARVTVQRGVVEVSYAGRVSRVPAGQEWPAEAVAPAIPPAPGVEVAAPGAALAGDPRALYPSGSTPSKATSRPSAKVVVPSEIAPAKPSPSPQTVFEQATALERGDPVRASQLYATLESGSDSWAQNALYARGRLAASRGHRAEARRLLEGYLERFPRGSNAEDARAVLERFR